MAARSPSPNPSRPTSNNPLLRTPENILRRSGGSFKSSITAESPQRNSGCLRASFEQKENEREPNCSKTPRVKSPIVSSSKGVKNFMAPTISAASKVIAASPRKKILGERNELISVFDSLELTGGGGEVPTKTDTGYGPRNVPNDVISVPNSLKIVRKPAGTRNVSEAAVVSNVSSAGVGVEEVGTKSEMGSGYYRDILDDPVIKSHKHVAVPTFTPNPALSPMDAADPSSKPYDPKSNYLSPRPQFLRYKPNPRFEQYRNKEGELVCVGGGKQLEDIFSSESSEEVAESTEAAQSEPQKESCPAEEDAEQFEDRTRVSESELELKPGGNHRPKSQSISWYKAVPLLLLVVVGCLYASSLDSPVLSSSSPILKNFDGLATRFSDWSADTVSYLTTMASPPKELGSFNPVNLTFSSLDQTVGSDLIFSTKKTETDWHLWDEMGKKSQMEVSECNDEDREELEEIHPVYHVESKFEDDSTEEVDEEVREMEYKMVPGDVREEVHPVKNEIESEDEEEFEKEVEEVKEITGQEHKEVECKAVPEDVKEEVNSVENETELTNEDNCAKELEQERSPSSHDDEQNIEEDIEGGEHKEVKYNAVPEDMTEKVHPVENDTESKNVERIPSKHIEEEIREEYATHHTTHRGLETVGDQDIQIQSVGSGGSLPGSPEEYQIPKGLESGELSDLRSDMIPVRSMLGVSLAVAVLAASLVFLLMKQNRTTAVARKGFPSKKQATLSGSSENYNGCKGTPCSGQQNDRRFRRESEASSSISYGSFTTYERVSTNKGCRDDEVVTPVRRSSRIRNLVTSP